MWLEKQIGLRERKNKLRNLLLKYSITLRSKSIKNKHGHKKCGEKSKKLALLTIQYICIRRN